MTIDVIIPAFNEEVSIGRVVRDIPKTLVRHIIVANNNSTDRTEEVAKKAGAIVVTETKKGYGSACLKGMEYIALLETPPDIIVFMDGDHADYGEEMPLLTDPIINENVDLVIGSRATGNRQEGSMSSVQLFGNWLASKLLKVIYGVTYTDLGPYRAIRYDRLLQLKMADKDFGWTVEMQVKAAKQGLSYREVPVSYRHRAGGVSKVSGTLKGKYLAGKKIILTIFKNI